MTIWKRIQLKLHRLFHWEYWPVWIVYLPCFLIYPFYATRARSFLFFVAANPSMDNGGAFLTSKKKVYDLFAPQLVPATLLVNEPTDVEGCEAWLAKHQIDYPLIAKPDFGLRGDGLKVIKSQAGLTNFFSTLKQAYIIQEYVEFENELGIFLVRQPDDSLKITSIVEREFMSVRGEGTKTLEELILETPRYAMQYDLMKERFPDTFDKVVPKGMVHYFDRIGNHSKGTKFKNGNYLITPELTQVMTEAMDTIKDFNYGRLDIKYASIEELSAGINYKILELNGAFSEPAHIYDPEYSLFKAWRDLLAHFKALFRVSQIGITKGVRPPSFMKGLQLINQQLKMKFS